MTTQEQRSYWRDSYYKHHERYKAEARGRAAKKRHDNPETPEEAEQRRVYMRAYHAKRRGDVTPEYFASLDERGKLFFKLAMIALLAKEAEARRSRRLAWRRKNEFNWTGQRALKAPKLPAAPRESKAPPTAEELEERRVRFNERQMEIRRRNLADPKWKAEFNAKKRAWSKSVLKKAKSDPGQLDALRAKRLAARKRWLDKMRAEQPEKYTAYIASQSKKEYLRRTNSIQRRLSTVLRTQVCAAIRRQLIHWKSMATLDLVGCSVNDLIAHLESQFQPGMSWANFGKGKGKWSTDHIRPCASFRLADPEQQKQCFHYSNLRPLWSIENSSKGSEWNGEKWSIWSHSDHACQPPAPDHTPTP